MKFEIEPEEGDDVGVRIEDRDVEGWLVFSVSDMMICQKIKTFEKTELVGLLKRSTKKSSSVF